MMTSFASSYKAPKDPIKISRGTITPYTITFLPNTNTET